jgi:hypothetical protein
MVTGNYPLPSFWFVSAEIHVIPKFPRFWTSGPLHAHEYDRPVLRAGELWPSSGIPRGGPTDYMILYVLPSIYTYLSEQMMEITEIWGYFPIICILCGADEWEDNIV